MPANRTTFLKDFYVALDPVKPSGPAQANYVPLYDNEALAPSDPIAELQTTIEWSAGESCQLFSGFRGTGKSTELRRLKAQLEQPGANTVVVLCDMQDYLNLSTPVDISDFLMATGGALGDALEADNAILGSDVLTEGYWTRFSNFMTRTKVDLTELGATAEPGGVGVEVKASLKADPTFRQRLQERMQGHIGALTRDVHAFVEECVKALRERHGEDVRIVLILDSVEQIRGTATNAAEVAESVANLFQSHAEKLRLPYLHVVYTVPPWLKIKAPATATLYNGCQQIPCVKVRDRAGVPFKPGLDALEAVVRARGDWESLLGSREALDQISLASGGYLRDLFRMLQATLRLTRGRGLPASQTVRELALSEIRNAYLPLSHTDAKWLARIDQSHGCELPDDDDLPNLARYFDNLLVMTYRNGDEWYGVHPLVVDRAKQIASELLTRRDASAIQGGASVQSDA